MEVTLPDGRVLNFPDGTSEDVMRAAIGRLLGADAPAPTPERTFGQTIYENVIGSGEADTFGEKLGQYIRGGTAAVARGMADAVALPVNVAQLGAMGVEKLFGMEDPSMVSRALDRLPDTRDMLGAVPVLGPESRYKAPGKVGEFLSTGGEFSGGAGLMSGAKAMLKYGLAPGLASEAAGQATEGTAANVEPFARAGAALLTPTIAGRVVSPFGGADKELLAAAQRARDIGLKPSAGQTVGSRVLQGVEDTLSTTPEQLDDIAAAAMKTVGSDAPRVTPAALVDVGKNLGNKFDDILAGVDSIPSPHVTAMVDDVVAKYIQNTPKDAPIPRVRTLAKDLAGGWARGRHPTACRGTAAVVEFHGAEGLGQGRGSKYSFGPTHARGFACSRETYTGRRSYFNGARD
jgi:hypothetical protein